jgi:hypothetical protein
LRFQKRKTNPKEQNAVASLHNDRSCTFVETARVKKLPTETLRPAVPDEHQPGCFDLEEERGSSWKGSGGTVPFVKEAKPSL